MTNQPGDPGMDAGAHRMGFEERIAEVRCVLFDLDGTLIDTVELIRESMRYATATVLGAPLPDEVLMRNVGVPLATQMREFSAEHADELVAVYREHNGRVHDIMVHEYPGTETALEQLTHAGFTLGVVTSKSRPVALRGLERFDLGRFFDVVIACEDVERHKPDPAPVLAGASALGFDPAECIYVGDSPHDMAAARDAGVLGVAALWGAFPRDVLLAPAPPFAVECMTDVPLLLAGDVERFRIHV